MLGPLLHCILWWCLLVRGDQPPRGVPGPLHLHPLRPLLPVQQQQGHGEVQLSARTPGPPATLQTGVHRGHRVPGLPRLCQVICLFHIALHTDTIFSNKCKDPCPGASCGPNSECRVTNHEAVCHCKLHYRGNPPNCRLATTTTTRRTTTTTKRTTTTARQKQCSPGVCIEDANYPGGDRGTSRRSRTNNQHQCR